MAKPLNHFSLEANQHEVQNKIATMGSTHLIQPLTLDLNHASYPNSL